MARHYPSLHPPLHLFISLKLDFALIPFRKVAWKNAE